MLYGVDILLMGRCRVFNIPGLRIEHHKVVPALALHEVIFIAEAIQDLLAALDAILPVATLTVPAHPVRKGPGREGRVIGRCHSLINGLPCLCVNLLVNRVLETVKADIRLTCLKEDIGLEGRTAGGEGQRLLKGLKCLFILSLTLCDGAAELQAAFLEEGSRHEGIRSAFTRQTLCLNGMLPALRVTPSDDIKGGKTAEAEGLPAIGKVRGR